ncbi:Single-stranded nucleic acid binding R3H [Ostreococcus tauri]|uniref:Single-stranded nucleic acid binding R3H n=1 Tax=Ostreococcus tauri TaxID=70448 RepID=A0A090M104_OSTTA|nr:Single-stranded nucleic acid binding R3H [Ostreococcus tauri]CEF97895.1 Single-stranded nucleic acid binding R3H [Ostreococcus tauri]|eukprot:XP_003079221.2 Single-stranded nucleic acid binding R3H [Ostreococcus tauri]
MGPRRRVDAGRRRATTAMPTASRERDDGRVRRRRGDGANVHASEGRFAAPRARALTDGTVGTERNDDAWWRALDDDACDPITLEPFNRMAVAPFEMLAEEGGTRAENARRGYMFDGETLAEYVTSSKCFENPLTRAEMSREQCRALDGYLAKWKLRKFSVEKAFNAARREKLDAEATAARRSEEQRANMAREREELRVTLARTMFTSIRERAAAERAGGAGGRGRRRDGGGVRRSTSVQDALTEIQAEGRFALVDDDVAMLRDVSLADGHGANGGPRPQDYINVASWGGWSRPSHIENRGNDFPALPGASSRGGGSGNWVPPVPVADESHGESFPTLGAGSSRSTPSWGTFAPRQSAAERFRAIPRNTAANMFSKRASNIKNGSSAPNAATTASTSNEQRASEPADEATARRNKLADAFGISKPDERPSTFAESSASAFTRAQLQLARKHPELVKRLEKTLEDIVMGKSKRRVSMEPMNREMRELCHVVAELYGITSASFGRDPNRHIDFFYGTSGGNKGGTLPSLRLSDAMLIQNLDAAPTKDSMVSKTRPTEETEYFDGYTKHFSKGEYEELALVFTDIAVGVSGVRSALREFSGSYVMQEIDEDHLVAHFWKHGALLQASGKLGGGMRGKFRVKLVEKKCKGKETSEEEASEVTSSSTSARLFRASTSSRVASKAPAEGQAAIDEALDMFGF